MSEGDPRLGERLPWRWDIALLGGLAGVSVIISAMALAIWDAVGIYDDYDAPLKVRLFTLWYMFVSIAWGGVAVILLAELLNKLGGPTHTTARRVAGRARYRRRA